MKKLGGFTLVPFYDVAQYSGVIVVSEILSANVTITPVRGTIRSWE